jgi:hypothetical protein
MGETFVPKTWKNYRAGGTDISAEELIDLEVRVTDYADEVAKVPGPAGPQGPQGPPGNDGADGGGSTESRILVSYHAADETTTATDYVPGTTPDILTFTLARGSVVKVYVTLNAWCPTTGSCFIALYVDDELAVNERGETVEGEGGGASETPAGRILFLPDTAHGTKIAIGSGFSMPRRELGAGLDFWLEAGEHTFELRYKTNFAGPAHYSKRRLIAMIATPEEVVT